MNDAYTCHKCHTRHTVKNMVAYCASCVHTIEQGLASKLEVREQKDDLFLSHQIAEVRRENAGLKARIIDLQSMDTADAQENAALKSKLEEAEKENKRLIAEGADCCDVRKAAESRCVESQSIHDQQVYSLNNQIARIMWQRDAALSRLASAEKVLRSVRGFRDHGEAKNGTHATIMFEDLAAHDAQTGEGK